MDILARLEVLLIWSCNMPGFNVGGIGGGSIPNTVEVRRKHRWVFETLGRSSNDLFNETALLMLQSASRPSFKFEQPEMHHNQEVVRFAGKQDWDPVTLVWYDGEQNPDVSGEVYKWLTSVVDLQLIEVALPSDYKMTASLTMLVGATLESPGTASEKWIMYGTWPAEVNWQELDYTSTDLMTIEATMRYDRALRYCPNGQSGGIESVYCAAG